MASVALPSKLAAIATRQHGVLTADQLTKHLSDRQVRYRCAVGALEPMFGRTFLVAGAPQTPSANYFSAAAAVTGSVVGGRAAAHVHRFPSFDATPPEVFTDVRIGHQVAGVTIHRRLDLLDRHRTEVDRIPVTSVPRTVLDLAAVVSLPQLIDVVDALVDGKRLSLRRLFDDFDRIARRGRNGTAAMRTVLEPRLVGLTMDRSELERRGLEFLARRRFPTPLTEFCPPWAGPAVARVDLAWPDLKLILELDGRKWHDRSDRFESDRLRDQLALAHGWIVARVTWRQLANDADGVAARLRAIFQTRNVA